MPQPGAKFLSPPEWKVMNIVWGKKACSARDVYLVAGELYDWAPNTVRTHLNRLVKKGFLKATLIGNSYLYRPKKTLAQTLFQMADDLLDKAAEGQAGPLLAYMVQKSGLTPGDIRGMRDLLNQYERQNPPKRE
ncbi:MAG: BlaI/MecI/CopY family transcriptional regulator [Candidatus Omnitrophica bacterium]|nr:BlaI/MecI/CopY family transcriptional regulator [Candidatus Omnitrophota bacterium]